MGMNIQPSEATLGAYVTGVKLASLHDEEFKTIHDAFLEHAVLIFPGQGLSDEQQEAFAERFGEIEILIPGLKTVPVSNKPEHAKFYGGEDNRTKLLKGNEGWHTDSSYMPLSAKASVLSARVVPSEDGETEWADMRDAYEKLDNATRTKIAELSAYHSYMHSQAKVGHEVKAGAGYGFFEGEPPLHPLVKIHPETQRPSLFIGRHIKCIKGKSEAETEKIIDELTDFACQAPRVLTHRWAVGDVAVWDNRCLVHRVRPYDMSQSRVMMHTRIRGELASESALNREAIG